MRGELAHAHERNWLWLLANWLLSDVTPIGQDEAAVLKQETIQEIVTLHARILLHMPLIQLIFVCALGWIVLHRVPWVLFLGWSVATVGMEGLRAATAAWVLARVHTFAPKRMHVMFMVLDALSGSMVGLAAILFLHYLPLLSQVLIEIVLFAIAAAGVSVAVSSKYMLAAYSFMVLLGASISWVVLHPDQALPVIGLTLLYWGFLLGVSTQSEYLLQRSVHIRRERDQMLLDLERSNAEAHAATILAEQSAQARARVLAAASHDLRQPLHALSIYSAILAANPSPSTLREVGHNIDQLVRALDGILTDLLDLSKLSSGSYLPQQQIFALDKTVADVCAEYTAAAVEKGLVLRSILPPIQLSGDNHAVARIVRNLIDNAIKYTDYGEICIAIEFVDGVAALSVTDTGKGIAAIEHERIFEEFYQTDNPGRDRSKGVGLGLAIVRRLCELMDARIYVESAPGEGACFRVAFSDPVLLSGSNAADRGEAVPPASLHGLRIYVIDDEQDIVSSMHTLLSLWGIEVRTGRSVREAEDLLAHYGRPDLLITDLRLREAEHGAAMATRLRTCFGPFPVLLITGETASQALRKVGEAGFVLLQKPISASTLHAAIEAVLELNLERG
ncbi:MAG: ATP-binding protein [Burkholderiales bacterium]